MHGSLSNFEGNASTCLWGSSHGQRQSKHRFSWNMMGPWMFFATVMLAYFWCTTPGHSMDNQKVLNSLVLQTTEPGYWNSCFPQQSAATAWEAWWCQFYDSTRIEFWADQWNNSPRSPCERSLDVYGKSQNPLFLGSGGLFCRGLLGSGEHSVSAPANLLFLLQQRAFQIIAWGFCDVFFISHRPTSTERRFQLSALTPIHFIVFSSSRCLGRSSSIAKVGNKLAICRSSVGCGVGSTTWCMCGSADVVV